MDQATQTIYEMIHDIVERRHPENAAEYAQMTHETEDRVWHLIRRTIVLWRSLLIAEIDAAHPNR